MAKKPKKTAPRRAKPRSAAKPAKARKAGLANADACVVYSYYEDEPQVVIDVLPAKTPEAAIERVRRGRPGAVVDPQADLLAEVLAAYVRNASIPLKRLEKEWRQLCRSTGGKP